MKKRYHDRYTGLVTLKGSLMRSVWDALKSDLQTLSIAAAGQTEIEIFDRVYQLYPFITLIEKIRQENITYRDGFDRIHCYFENFDQFQSFIDWADQMSTDYDLNWVHTIHGMDQFACQGTVTVTAKQLINYQYKVMFNENHAHLVDPAKLKNLFDQFADSVKLTQKVKNFLVMKPDKSTFSLWLGMQGTYFYAKNEEVITYLSLVYPEIIKKIYRLHHVTKSQSATE